IAYGLLPPGVLLHALYSGKVRRFSTLLAGITLLAQIDAKRCFDREYDLAFLWSLAAPAGWVTCGILLLDVARLMLTGRGTDWKGRQLILFPKVSHKVRVVPSYDVFRPPSALVQSTPFFACLRSRLRP